MHTPASNALSLPFAIESSWCVGKFEKLKVYVDQAPVTTKDFNVGMGQALLALSERNPEKFSSKIEEIRVSIARNLSVSNTASLQDCHDAMIRCHILAEVEAITQMSEPKSSNKAKFLSSLDQRLDILGPFLADKQYVLGLRRAAMQLSM